MKFFTYMMVLWLYLLSVGGSLVDAQVDIVTLKKGVVKIVTEFSNTRKIGTGFIAARSHKYVYLVTASHVVEGEVETPQAIQVTFFTNQGETFPAKIVKMEGDNSQGLALLKVKGELPDDVQILAWDTGPQVVGGEEIHLIGFPRVGGNDWAVTKGTLSGMDGSVLKFSGAVAEGNSGGLSYFKGE